MINFKLWLESKEIAKDRNGREIVDLVGNPFMTDGNGYVDLYHATNKQSYEQIITSISPKNPGGLWIPAGMETEVFFSNFERGGEGFGDYIIHVKILPKFIRLDDAYRNGEVHCAVKHKILGKYGKIIT